MALKLDHIAIATAQGSPLAKILEDFTGAAPVDQQIIESQAVSASFADLPNSSIELISPASEQAGLNKFLAKNGDGLHHIAFLSDDIHADLQRLSTLGYQPLTSEPAVGARGKKIIFFHPKTTGGILIELCQKP